MWCIKTHFEHKLKSYFKTYDGINNELKKTTQWEITDNWYTQCLKHYNCKSTNFMSQIHKNNNNL